MWKGHHMTLADSAFSHAVPRVADEFSPSTLRKLILGELEVIWHKGFFPASVAAEAVPRIELACEAANYTMTSDLQSLGTSIGEAAESEENCSRYFATAQRTTALIRDGSSRSAITSGPPSRTSRRVFSDGREPRTRRKPRA